MHVDADDRYGKLHATVLKRDKRFMYSRDKRGYCQRGRDAVQTRRHIDQPDVTEELVEPSEWDAVDTAVDAVDGVDGVDAGTEELSEQSESDAVDTAVDACVIDACRKLLETIQSEAVLAEVDHDYAEKALVSCRTAIRGFERTILGHYAKLRLTWAYS